MSRKRVSKSRQNAIGVEIGTSMIKVVALRPGSPPSLQHAVMTTTPIGSIRDGLVVEPQAVAAELKALLQANKIAAKYAVTAIPNQSVVTRNIMVPKMDRKDLDEAIQWEAEKYIPYPLEEVNLDYDMLDDPATIPEDGQMELVIAAARSEDVAKQAEVLRLAGLEPTVVDLKSFATLRALRGNLLGQHRNKTTLSGLNYTEEGEVGVVLEMGASSSVISLVRGDRVLMNRNINVAADDFTTALQKEFGLDFDAAESVKLGYVASSGSSDEELLSLEKDPQFSSERVYEVLRPVLGDLVTEIRRSLEFYRVQNGDVMIDHGYVAGGGAKLQGLPEALTEALGFRVEVADPWLSVQSEGSNVDAGYLRRHGPEFTVPLGLALRGV